MLYITKTVENILRILHFPSCATLTYKSLNEFHFLFILLISSLIWLSIKLSQYPTNFTFLNSWSGYNENLLLWHYSSRWFFWGEPCISLGGNPIWRLEHPERSSFKIDKVTRQITYESLNCDRLKVLDWYSNLLD